MQTTKGSSVRQIRVVVVDDHDLFRAGLASVLASNDDIEVVGQASGGRMAVRLVFELRPDVVLMDMRMPDLDGAAAIREIIEGNPEARVLALTVASDESDIAAAVVAGACGYLLKDSPIDDVVQAVRASARGVAWLSPRAAATLLERIRRDYAEPPRVAELETDLSPRELEV